MSYKQRLNKFGYTELFHFYITEQRSISDIAKLINCNAESLRQKLHRLGIPVRKKSISKYIITKETLEQEYTKNQKTYKQIAAMFRCGETLIYTLMRKYGIKPRERYGHMKGRTFSIEHREKLSQAKQGTFSGTNNPNWKGGVTITNTAIRRSAKYCAFRARVLRFKGKVCHQCGKNLNDKCKCCGHKTDKHVHHIKDFANNEELRYSLSNAIVLCDICHKSIHKKQ